MLPSAVHIEFHHLGGCPRKSGLHADLPSQKVVVIDSLMLIQREIGDSCFKQLLKQREKNRVFCHWDIPYIICFHDVLWTIILYYHESSQSCLEAKVGDELTIDVHQEWVSRLIHGSSGESTEMLIASHGSSFDRVKSTEIERNS